MKLSDEQYGELLELVESDSFKILTTVVLQQIIQQHTNRLLSVDFVSNERELLIERARLDGATKLAADIRELKKMLKRASNNLG